jgi:hypothetical protein
LKSDTGAVEMKKTTSIGKPIEDLSLDHQCTYRVENLGERQQQKHLLRDDTHGICQGAQEKYNDRNDDTGMLSSPVTDDIALYRWNKGGAKACFVNIDTVYNIASHNRRAKIRKSDGGSTVRGARNRGWC